MFPTDCNDCDIENNINCERHKIVNCIEPDCTKKFHKDCLCTGVLTDANLQQLSERYVCMECQCKSSAGNAEDTPFASLPSNETSAVLREKLSRFGLDHEVSIANTLEEREAALKEGNTRMKKLQKALKQCNSCLPDALANEGNEILDSKPRAYPCPVGISDQSVDKHVQYGRRAELSLLLYKVQQCGCCGSVQPCHSDPYFPKAEEAPLSRMHLMNQTHKAWHCTCQEYCRGSQFYAHLRSSVMNHYREKHGGLNPEQYGNSHGNCVSETVLCHKCYTEVEAKNVTDLAHGFVFSTRNGFGPIHIHPPVTPGEDVNITRSRELYQIGSTLTPVEEAAIRLISPLIPGQKHQRWN